MHTKEFKEYGVAFNYNSDLSGDVEIATLTSAVSIPGAALLEFVAEFVREQKLSAVEKATAREILGL